MTYRIRTVIDNDGQITVRNNPRLNSSPVIVEELIDKARKFEKKCSDYSVSYVSPRKVHFNGDGKLTFIDDYGDDHTFAISHLALNQLGSKIGVPGSYIEKCVTSGRIELAQKNINSWLSDYNGSLFIRVYDGKIRGVLTDKYSVCDSLSILGVINEVIDQSFYEVKGWRLDSEQLHIRLVARDMLRVDGEDLYEGLFINSSDVGCYALTVEYGIFKQICSNGLYLPKAGGLLFQQRHRGISWYTFYDRLATSLLKARQLSGYAIEMIDTARTWQCWGRTVDWRSAIEVEQVAKRIQVKTQLSKESTMQVISFMREKYGTSHWGLINSITEVAKQYSLERRLELEHIAGNILGQAKS